MKCPSDPQRSATSFYRWGNWSPRRWMSFVKVTHRINSKDKTRNLISPSFLQASVSSGCGFFLKWKYSLPWFWNQSRIHSEHECPMSWINLFFKRLWRPRIKITSTSPSTWLNLDRLLPEFALLPSLFLEHLLHNTCDYKFFLCSFAV